MARPKIVPVWTCSQCGKTVVDPVYLKECPVCGSRSGKVTDPSKSEWNKRMIRIPPSIEVEINNRLQASGRSFQEVIDRALELFIERPQIFWGRGD